MCGNYAKGPFIVRHMPSDLQSVAFVLYSIEKGSFSEPFSCNVQNKKMELAT